MFQISDKGAAAREPALYRGAQYELVVRGLGLLSIVGVVTALVLTAFYPPTAQIGAAGWGVVGPASAFGLTMGALSVTLARRPGAGEVYGAALLGVAQIAIIEWLAGGGRAPYVQLLLLPALGASASQSVRRCAPVVAATLAAALSPLLYSRMDVPGTVTEFALLGTMTLMLARVMTSTREHRAALRDAGERANALAHLDQLTGMPNRRAFEEALDLELACAAIEGSSCTLVLCDVDCFKEINDTYGHAAGDTVLRSIAAALGAAVRGPDTAFRWAGDEFAVILRDVDEIGAGAVAGRLRATVAELCVRPDGRAVSLGVGIARLQAGIDAETLLVRADAALLEDKSRRRALVSAA